MTDATRPRGLRLREVIVLVVVLGILVCLAVPWVLSAREDMRRAQCLNNLKSLGQGMLEHESALKRFPPSCHVWPDPDGEGVILDGWSWCVDILPYMGHEELASKLDLTGGVPLSSEPGPVAAMRTVIAEFHCPTFNGSPYVDSSTKAEAITNYKALGATHIESLNVASPDPTVPRYNPDSDKHPDGGIYPGSTHGVDAFKIDGTDRSLLLVETVEQNVARWTVGNECAVVGLPPVVTFEWPPVYPYVYPTGYTAYKFWEDTTIPPEINQTYMKWDYDKRPYDDGGINTPSAAASGPIKYGPSSHHVGVTNHVFADGSVKEIDNTMDAALYMFLVNRESGIGWPRLE